MLAEHTLVKDLPAGYTARPARLKDAEALTGMLNQATQALLGLDLYDAAEWRTEMQSPGFNLETDTQAVLAPDGTIAGALHVWDNPPFTLKEHWGHVHPAHTGRGLGTWLLAWAEARARQTLDKAPQADRVLLHGFVNKRDRAAHAVLRAAGHSVVRQNVRMVIDFDAPPPAPEWPQGVRGRTFVRGQDDRATLECIRESFRDHWGHVEQPFEESFARWQHWLDNDPEFDQGLWVLAVDEAGRIIGTSLGRWKLPEDPAMAWISSLGVVRPWRRRGVALAMLQYTFAVMYARGRLRVGLGVDADSLTGATRLYEKAGMRRDPRFHYEIVTTQPSDTA
jgi:mycothiol synthase